MCHLALILMLQSEPEAWNLSSLEKDFLQRCNLTTFHEIWITSWLLDVQILDRLVQKKR